MTTTRTKTQTAEPVDELAAETEAVLAEWKQKKDDERRERATIVANGRIVARRRAERAKEPGYWASRLARHGMAEVTAAPGWADCPVPEHSASGVNFSGHPTDHPRPVAYAASVWTLDGKGVHLRDAGYWISSPVFQIQRGVNGASDRFAVLVDGTWRIVDGPPIVPARVPGSPSTGQHLIVETLQRLTAAGLVLNRQPLQVTAGRVPLSTLDNPELVAVLHDNAHVTGISAGEQLAAFLDAHKTEATMREGNRR